MAEDASGDAGVTIDGSVRSNPLRSRHDWESMRRHAMDDPGGFHGAIAKREIHWYHPDGEEWLHWDEERDAWTGYDGRSGDAVERTFGPGHEPWDVAFDDSTPPLYSWFSGGRTNACFNEVDRHILAGRGDEIAFHFEGDRWDQSKRHGRGGPLTTKQISRRQLLIEVVAAAQVLRNLGLSKGDRIVLNMPNIMEQIYYTEAAKRLGIIYTPVFGGFSDKTLSDRIAKLDADVLITSDGGYRNAEIVPFKEQFADPALDDYLEAQTTLAIVRRTLADGDVADSHAEMILEEVEQAIADEITVGRSQAMQGVGRALDRLTALSGEETSRIRMEIARALTDSSERIAHVIVVQHTGHDVQLYDRDAWSHDLLAEARTDLVTNARDAGFEIDSFEELETLPDLELVRALWSSAKVVPVDAEYPLFVMFTSGSTGAPKGVVHVHGGYTAGIAHTMRIAFDIVPGEDTIFTVADPGWITGQSYLISAALTTRTTSILLEGSPTYPDAGRFSSVIERHGATVFKAGVTFLKGILEDNSRIHDMRQWSTESLRVATFCAEPVSPAVQAFGMDEVCPWYSNSYWATEHGGIVWTHFYGNTDFPLRSDAHTYPLPWIDGAVWVEDETVTDGDRWRDAGMGERGEIVIEAPFPYLMRYVWGDVEHWDGADWRSNWRGDVERFVDEYWTRRGDAYAYLQGDVAKRHAGEAFSFHGRSDEVINVSGHRLGTEEIEGAILLDTRRSPDSPVGNVVVVGADHHERGLTPVAFIQPAPGAQLTPDDESRLSELVREQKGPTAVPDAYIEVDGFPETRSGKYMRRMLSALLNGESIGDTSTLKNPEAIEQIRPACERWRRLHVRAADQAVFERYRHISVQFTPVRGGRDGDHIATLCIDNPPVNALSERTLDELNTALEHLDHRGDVGAVVITGAGPSTFVAGADIVQFHEEIHTFEDAIAFPHKAHEAFRRIEGLSVPVVAAVNGDALGGGNELQLAAHYSVADRHAVFGQPELSLNLIPGYGGTQRLPRILYDRRGADGLRDAVAMITHGRSMAAETAVACGIVDELATDSSARIRASTLARSHILGRSTTLASARTRRLARRDAWCDPGSFPDTILEDTAIQRNRKQCRSVGGGREEAFERAMRAVRIGFESGIEAGYDREATEFAEALVDPAGGVTGIEWFRNRETPPLPMREPLGPTDDEDNLLASGEMLPVGTAFIPGVDPIPSYQYAHAVTKDDESGEPRHGEPADVEEQLIVPVEEPGPTEVLVYVLASEVNFNDIWAITGVPVSQFDVHDQDYHITGSGGVGLVVDIGEAVAAEERIAIGDVVTIYSGQSELLSPRMGLDPMAAGFSIQGYEGPDGSHQQFMIAQGPQVLPIPDHVPFERAGAYVLASGTVWRALFTTLDIEPGTTMFVEGGATGTGWEATKLATRNDIGVTGLCSSEKRADRIASLGAHPIDRTSEPFADLWGRIPADEAEWEGWKATGEVLVSAFEDAHDGRRADYAVSHAGELAFPRTFQMLGEGGTLTFYGASTGYHLTFLGKAGSRSPMEMFDRAGLRAGQAVAIYYGTRTDSDGIVDRVALRAIEAARVAGSRIVVITYTDEQQDFVDSMGYGDAVRATISLEGLARRNDRFWWPETLPDLPDARADPESFRRVVRGFTDEVFKPLGRAIGSHLHTPSNPRGYADIVFERADHDTLFVSTMLVKPYTGRVIYSEDMADRRYAMYAPQVWMRQRDVLMPSASIRGSHLSSAYEVTQLNEAIGVGEIELTDPHVVDWEELPECHQAMWDNTHEASSYVVNHALPEEGLTTVEDLYIAWADRAVGED